MEIIKISDLTTMLKNGVDHVIENREIVDKINVFPIPDQDTGSNLTKTLASFKSALGVTPSPDGLLTKALEAGLASSQGNSGLLIISYLTGLLQSLRSKKEVNYFDFLNAFKNASDTAKKSVENPIDGTMLDVMEAFSESFSEKQNHNLSLEQVFKSALIATRTSLVKTETKMKILGENHVVDAGALGFTLFIYGFSEKITGMKLDLSTLDASPVKIPPSLKNLEFPYEIIFTLENSSLTQDEIRNVLASYGDSLDIVALGDKTKVHIHTNFPEAVSETAQVLGIVRKIQTFDMRKKNPNHI